MNGQRTPTRIPYAGIICPYHGAIDIDEANYKQQMANPNARWVCPLCGQTSEFNDTRFDELHYED